MFWGSVMYMLLNYPAVTAECFTINSAMSEKNALLRDLWSLSYLFQVLKALLALLNKYPSITTPLGASTLNSTLVSS